MPTKTKPILASAILADTIKDFTDNPEHWVQEQWNGNTTWEDTLENEQAEDQFHAAKPLPSQFPKVTEPGNGKYSSWDIFEFEDVFKEPVEYCGLGGVQQSAYRMNKASGTDFWDKKFQTQLGLVGAYLNAAAKKLTYVHERVRYNMDLHRYVASGTVEEHFGGFIDFNDWEKTTLKDVLKLMRGVLKQLKAKEKAAAERAKARKVKTPTSV